MDHFMEEVVVKQNRTLNNILYGLSLIVMVLSAIMAASAMNMLFYGFNILTLIITLLFAAIAVLLYMYRDRLRTEYEYTFTNGALDFAQVFNNKKRKSLGSLNVRTVDAFGPVDSDSFRRYINTPNIKQSKWFLNRDANLYYFYFAKEGNKRIIVLEPSEELVDMIKHYLAYGAWQA